MLAINHSTLIAAVLAILLVVSPSEAEAKIHSVSKRGNNRWGAGSVKNTKVQQIIRTSAYKISGNFYIMNVATGEHLWYTRTPQTIIPSPTNKGVITLSSFGAGTRVRPAESNNKCLAAQFNSAQGVDYAGTMYACTTSKTRAVDAGNPQAKQQWHFVPVSGRSKTYFIIPDDHLGDMKTRALSSTALTTFGGYQSTSISVYDSTDPHQMWVLTNA